LVKIIQGDCRDVLAGMAEESVHCCVTSPPYWGLRDYGIPPTIWGGDPACAHIWRDEITARPNAGGGDLTVDGGKIKQREASEIEGRISTSSFCQRCGAYKGALGLEPTLDLFVQHVVEVFRAVRRVLRKDGVCFLNLGDSYSTGVSNASDFLAASLKGHILFYGGADPRGRSSERINVLLYDKAAPNDVFEPLFASQRISIKNGQDHLCEIGGFFDPPILCLTSVACLRRRFPQDANTKRVMDLPENVGIIVTAGDLHADAALRKAAAFTIKNGKAAFAIKIAGEPIAESVPGDVPVWDAITLNSGPEGAAQIDAVDQPIALLDGSKFLARRRDNFRIREAGHEQLTLALHCGCQISFLGVAHLFASNNGLTPYGRELDKAQRQANANRAKQELGIPDLVKRALMEDGWICRQTIIWSKKNPMPESCTDRCTKSHEFLFLLTKSARYFYDAEAIKESGSVTSHGGGRIDKNHTYSEGAGRRDFKSVAMQNPHPAGEAGRNKRSVWEIATAPFPEAHFATFPPALIEPCIKAGTSARGCCAKCGAPWERMTSKITTFQSGSGAAGKTAEEVNANGKWAGIQHGKNIKLGPVNSTVTTGWRPTCTCDAAVVPCTVLDPFGGAGTTGLVSKWLNRSSILIEMNPKYITMMKLRLNEKAARHELEEYEKEKQEKSGQKPVWLD
jgi:DNA modification methylase